MLLERKSKSQQQRYSTRNDDRADKIVRIEQSCESDTTRKNNHYL